MALTVPTGALASIATVTVNTGRCGNWPIPPALEENVTSSGLADYGSDSDGIALRAEDRNSRDARQRP